MAKPIANFEVGQTVRAKVIGYHDLHSTQFLPVSHSDAPAIRAVDLTMRPEHMSLPEGALANEGLQLAHVKKGDILRGVIQQVTRDCLWILLSPRVRGRVFILDASHDIEILSHPKKHFFVGDPVRVLVTSVDAENHTLDLSIKAAAEDTAITPQNLQPGMTLPGRISKIIDAVGLNVQLFSHTYGRVHLTDIQDNFTANPLKAFKVGQIVRCAVLERGDRLDLSLRPSRIQGRPSPRLPEIRSESDLQEGQLVQGYVISTSAKGCFVALARNLTARVLLANLSDSYVRSPAEAFPPGRLVTGRVVKVDLENHQVDLSLRLSFLFGKRTPSYAELQVGQKVRGSVTKVEQYGAFLSLEQNPRLCGLLHRSEMIDPPEPEVAQEASDQPAKKVRWWPAPADSLHVGDKVEVVVTKVELGDKPRLCLSSRPSRLANAPPPLVPALGREEEDLLRELLAAEESGDLVEGSFEALDSAPQSTEPLGESDLDALVHGDEGDEEIPEVAAAMDTEFAPAPSNETSADATGFEWDDFQMPYVSTQAPREGTADSPATAPLASVDSDRTKEERLIDEQAPETTEDFERLLAAAPNSSFLWVRYVAHLLAQSEVDTARRTLERALQTVHFREGREKLNIWVAWLNLEQLYGTPESLLKVFERACGVNDAKAVHLHLLGIHERSGNVAAAEGLYERCHKLTLTFQIANDDAEI